MLEAVRCFQPGPWGGDPFEKPKRQQEGLVVERLAEAWVQIADVEPEVALEALLHSCLWGNRADLGNYTISVQAQRGLTAREERCNILIDHTGSAGTAHRRSAAGGLY